MFRKLPLALMMGALLTSSHVAALGVGDIKVNSALNQKLSAEIEILSNTEGELDDLTVKLAAPEDFQRINLDRPYHLTAIKFKVTTRKDGTPIISLSTDESVREPFLDFLVELDWPKGRMLREYTVLLDPPVTMAAQKPATKPAMVATEGERYPKAPWVDDSGKGEGVGVSEGYTGDSYGPVSAKETLWSIASKVRPDSDVSVQQMMLALFEANPDAFINGDIHHLKRGHILRIPDRSSILAREKAQAIQEVREINAALPVERVAAEPAEPVSEPMPAEVEPDSKLTLLAPGGVAPGTAAGQSAEMESLKRELELASETMARQRMENEDLKSRVQELESTISEMDKLKRLLEMQNQEMAELQRRLAGEKPEPKIEAPAVAAKPEPKKPAAVEVKPAAKPKPKPVKKPSPPPQPKGVMDIVMDYVNKVTSNPVLLGIVGGVVIVVIALVALVSRRKKGAAEAVEEAAPTAPEPEAKAGSLGDKIKSLFKRKEKPEAVAATTAAAEVFADVGRSEDETAPGAAQAAEMDITEAPVTDIGAAGMEFEAAEPEEAAPAVEAEPTPEPTPPPAPEPTPEPVAAAPEEEDPLEEVDVYEAFGDYEQASEIVKQAIADYPDRSAYKLRLFQLYRDGAMTAEFSSAISEYKAALEGSAEWDEIVAIANEFAPESLMGGGEPAGGVAEEPSAPAEAPSAVADDEIMDVTMAFDMETDQQAGAEAEQEPAEAATSTADIGDMDFELDTSGAEAAIEEPEAEGGLETPAETAEESHELEFDLGDMELGSTQEPAETVAAPQEQGNELEFDLTDVDLGTTEEPEPVAEPEAQGNEIEFDMGDMSFESEEEPQPEETFEETLEPGNELEFELDELTDSDLAPSSEDETVVPEDAETDEGSEDETVMLSGADAGADLTSDFSADGDEVSTKLDLARAYIDMGDAEGAREILGEVAEEGNDEQKQEAAQLLQSI